MPPVPRRTLLAATATALLPTAARAQPAPFTVPPLPYDYAALEPVISRETMTLHHDRHHQAYVDNLNKALADQPALQARGLDALLADLPAIPEPLRATIRNNGGGHLNHTLFWQMMRAPTPGAPIPDPLKSRIEQDFGSVDAMKAKFEDAGTRQFGSGWVFLAYDPKANRTAIVTTANQDTPLSPSLTFGGQPGATIPLLGNDVWEHAYYLTYRNRRADYLKAWWAVADWDFAARRLAAARG